MQHPPRSRKRVAHEGTGENWELEKKERNKKLKAAKIALQIKVLATKPETQSSILRSHMMEERTSSHRVL